MGVYIKGMEMPHSCDDCRLKSSYVYAVRTEECSYYRRSVDPYVSIGKRPDWCPLVEVPPHGRLVDESWLKKAMITTLEALKKNPKMDGQEMHLIAAFDTLGKMVDDAPTIIEREE